MSIRSRITFWFTGILFLCLLIMTGVFHYELNETRQALHTGQPVDSVLEETGEFVLYFGLPAAVLLLVGGSWLMHRSLRPISRLTVAVENLHLNRLHERLPALGTNDELDRLTEVFNAMTARLEQSFAHVREFTLHASHELKTPLTIMQGELESSLNDPDLKSTQRDRIVSQMDEVQRLARIVDGLMLLAKADAGQMTLKMETTRLDEIVRDSFSDAQLLARPQRITVTLPTCDMITVHGDPCRLRQLLLNLTDNAIKYNHPGGTVEIVLRRNRSWAELTLTNTGPGIAPEHLPRVFDRFFRGDPAHSSKKEGCGLGLSIAKWIVESHGGNIRVDSCLAGPTQIRVQIPFDPNLG